MLEFDKIETPCSYCSIRIKFCNYFANQMRSVESIEMDTSKQSTCSSLPQRIILGGMAFFGIVASFLMRQCLSVAITEMVETIDNGDNMATSNNSVICPADSFSIDSRSITKIDATKFSWSQEQQGWILSSFFIGYVIAHLPAGYLAQKFGGKWTLSLSVLITAICNASTPLAVEYGDYQALIFIRILMGLAAGIIFPALSVLLAAWVPEKERGKLASIVLSGGQIGTLLSFYVTGVFLSHWPWPIVFYFWSAVSIIWFILFTFLCYKDPASHPFISKEELDYLEKEMGQLKRHDNMPATPWSDILTSRPIIILVITQVCNDFVFHIMSSDLPKYMKEVLGFSVRDTGLYSSIPYFSMWVVSVLAGFICDHLISGNYVTVTQARKIFNAVGSVVPAIFIIAASYAGCSKMIAVVWFTLALAFLGNYYPGLRVNLLDLSPNYAGPIMALSNGFASFSGVAAPVFVGIMTPDTTLEQWRLVFWASFAVSMFKTVIFSIWASGKVQPWDKPKQHESLESCTLTNNIENDTASEHLNCPLSD